MNFAANASEYYEELNYCSWMGNAAYAVAKNRDLGMDEYSLIEKYLKQGDNYEEQVIVINLIDRIYGPLVYESAFDVKIYTKSKCLGMLFSSKFDENA
ncbi:MAG: hypothetical protein ACR2PU_03545 [Gammaproteobacteria bacterium]